MRFLIIKSYSLMNYAESVFGFCDRRWGKPFCLRYAVELVIKIKQLEIQIVDNKFPLYLGSYNEELAIKFTNDDGKS